MRILIIEDEKELLQDIAKGLTLKGYAVDQDDNGKTGCQMAVDEEYDLVVLDLNLPEMDGFSILKELRQNCFQTKVLILSANSELDSKLSVPLMPEWEEYFIRELKDRKILKRLNVFSTNTEFAAYAVTLKKGETQIAKILTDGLESGEICIPNAKRDDTAFGDIETFTQYLNAFGKDIAKKNTGNI